MKFVVRCPDETAMELVHRVALRRNKGVFCGHPQGSLICVGASITPLFGCPTRTDTGTLPCDVMFTIEPTDRVSALPVEVLERVYPLEEFPSDLKPVPEGQ